MKFVEPLNSAKIIGSVQSNMLCRSLPIGLSTPSSFTGAPRHALLVANAVRSTEINVDKAAAELEQCILSADGEDGVKTCMELYDKTVEMGELELDWLEACIIDAKSEYVQRLNIVRRAESLSINCAIAFLLT